MNQGESVKENRDGNEKVEEKGGKEIEKKEKRKKVNLKQLNVE